jgi:hypothetical protein
MALATIDYGNSIIKSGNYFPILTDATNGGTSTLTLTSSGTLRVIGTNSSQTVVLPNATTLTIGHRFEILNGSSGNILINDNGGTTINTVYPGRRVLCICTSISTAAGGWWTDIFSMSTYGDDGLWSLPVGTVTSVSGGATLTAAQLYSGPISCSSGTLYLPRGSGSNNLLVQLTSLLGYTPPVGFHWTAYIHHSSSSSLDFSVGSGGYRITAPGADRTDDAVLMIPICITSINYGTSPISCTYTCFRMWFYI